MELSNGPSFGERLQRERKLLNLSQRRLAKAIGTTVISINRWEHDKVLPQAYYREQLCRVLGKSTEELFGTLDIEHHQHTRFPSIWNVPYLRNIYFTGREAVLTTLHETFAPGNTIAAPSPYALTGLG